MGSGVTLRTSVTDVLLRRNGVLVVVDGGHAAGRAKVVAGSLEGALAPLAVVGLAQTGVAVVAVHAGANVIKLLFLIYRQVS
jgi:hypothetical protein